MNPRRVFILALTAMIAAKIVLAVLSLGRPANPLDFLRPVDDAYISYRYAANAADGKGLVYNEGERVEGGTTFALIAMLVPFALAGIRRIDLVAVVLSLAAQAGAVAYAWRFMRRDRDEPAAFPEILVAVFLTLSLTDLVWAWAGMEVSMQALVWLAAVWAHLRERETASWPIASALLTVLAGLLHPDAILIGAVLGLSWLWPFDRGRAARGVGYGAIVIALFGGYWIARWAYFGQPLPNTFYAKVSGGGVSFLGAGLTYLRVALFSTVLPAAALALLAMRGGATPHARGGRIALAVAGALAFVAAPNWLTAALIALAVAGVVLGIKRGAAQPRWFWIFLGLAAVTIPFIVRVGGDFYPFHRFFQPLLAPMTLVFWKLWRDARPDAPAVNPKRAIARALAIVIALNAWSYFYTFQGLIHRDLQRVVKHFAATGRALKSALPPEATVATLPIGAVGFFSERRIHDMMGLVEPHIARMDLDMTKGVIGHQKYDHAYTLGTRPEAIIVLPSIYPRTPEGFERWILENALEPVQYRIYEQPALHEEYQLVYLNVAGNTGAYGFLRRGLLGKPGYESWEALGEEAVRAAFATPERAAAHPLHGRSFGIWSFK